MKRRSEWRPWPSYGHRLGKNLRDLRRMRGLSQERLAELVGMTRNSISNIERNENNSNNATDPRLSTIYRLAAALDIPPAVLLPGGGHHIEDICASQQLGIEITWPADGRDTLPFAASYIHHGKPEEPPRYAVTAAWEDIEDEDQDETEGEDGHRSGG